VFATVSGAVPGCSLPVAAIHVAPGVPEIAATNRWLTAPIASAATAFLVLTDRLGITA
jgi:hypothetical protein